ncbi:MAG: hypothetical protein I8H71_01400 [Xanthomonadaceae bacterium]|nr:hypothetical protein [Xanthomonadaceae bacterium]
MQDKAPSKTATLKAERAARKAAKARAKAEATKQLADLKERAQQLCSRMPPAYQDWGVTKTRAYAKLMQITRHKAQLKAIKPARLAVYVGALEQSETWSLDYCQALSQLPDTARDISCETRERP